MLNDKRLMGFIGIGAWVWFWAVSFVLGALRPSYSHVARTLSELGARGTSHAMLWNLLGFMVTGVLVAATGAAIVHAVEPKTAGRRIGATTLFVLTGLAIAGQGALPADMANGLPDATSLHTRAHLISSVLSGLFWLIGIVVLLGAIRKNPDWRGVWVISMVFVALTLVASFTLRGVMPEGLAQRTGNLIVCAWYVIMSARLVQLGTRNSAGSADR